MSETITIVVIGGSGMIGKRHVTHVVKNSSTQLFGIVDPSPAGRDVADLYSTTYFPSMGDLLKSKCLPDAAIVCTPNHTHVPISIQLVEAGIHVLVEKPISISVSSAESLIEKANAHNVHLLVGHHRRFNPYILAAKKVVDSGELGDVLAVSALWTAFKPPSYFESEALQWRSSRANGGGVVLINMIHEIDLMHYFFGPIIRVHAEKTQSKRPIHDKNQDDAVEEGAAVTLKFSSGVVGTFIISDHVASPHHFESGTGENPMMPKTGMDVYRIFGTRGTLSVPDMVIWTYGSQLPTWTAAMEKEIADVPNLGVAPFDMQLAHFVRVVRGQEKPSCSGEDGLLALQVCEAIRDALESEGGTVEIGNIDGHPEKELDSKAYTLVV